MIMHRRSLLLAAPALLAPRALAAAVPPGNRIAFAVSRNESRIGTHVIDFARDGQDVRVSIAIDFAVRFLGITAFRYTHRNTETWRGDRLISLTSTTDNNGTPLSVQARANGAGIAVEGSQSGAYVAPIETVSTSYWHAAFLRERKIDTQGGQLLDASIERLGEEMILIGEAQAPAQRWRVTGDLTLDIWYDKAGAWSGLRFARDDGSVINYVRT